MCIYIGCREFPQLAHLHTWIIMNQFLLCEVKYLKWRLDCSVFIWERERERDAEKSFMFTFEQEDEVMSQYRFK